jgi:hypothetical protein
MGRPADDRAVVTYPQCERLDYNGKTVIAGHDE